MIENRQRKNLNTSWDYSQDMVEWLAIWGTGFICYIADTQYWFVLGCGLLGFVLCVYQRGWRFYTLVIRFAFEFVGMARFMGFVDFIC